MPIAVHPLMQDADDIEPDIRPSIKYQVLTDRILEVPGTDIGFPARPDAFGERFNPGDQIVMVSIGLCERPMFARVEPDILQISFCER
jgi:hypothetical protein